MTPDRTGEQPSIPERGVFRALLRQVSSADLAVLTRELTIDAAWFTWCGQLDHTIDLDLLVNEATGELRRRQEASP